MSIVPQIFWYQTTLLEGMEQMKKNKVDKVTPISPKEIFF